MVTYIGSIPIYDYSLGVRVHPPLYISRLKNKRDTPYLKNNVVDLVYNGECVVVMAKRKSPTRCVEKCNDENQVKWDLN